MQNEYQLQVELPDGSHFESNIQDYFEYIIKTYETMAVNALIEIYEIYKIENRITFKVKAGYFLELLIPENTTLLGSTKSKITKNENGKNMPHLEITEVTLLVHCNIVNNDYQQGSRVLYTFGPSKLFGQLLGISPQILYS